MKQGKINKKLNDLDSKATGNQNSMERIMLNGDFGREGDYATRCSIQKLSKKNSSISQELERNTFCLYYVT